jgi:hypothetical protein
MSTEEQALVASEVLPSTGLTSLDVQVLTYAIEARSKVEVLVNLCQSFGVEAEHLAQLRTIVKRLNQEVNLLQSLLK